MPRHQEQTCYNGHPYTFFPLFFLILIAEVIIVKEQTFFSIRECHYCEVSR